MVIEEYSSAQAKAHKAHKDYEGVLYLKYAKSESPALGRYFPPEGHEHYRKPFSEAMADCVKRGLVYQGRLWDAYDKCSHDVSIVKVARYEK